MSSSLLWFEAVFLRGSTPTQTVSSAFGRTGFGVDASHVFPRDVLATVTLEGARLVLEEAEPVQGGGRNSSAQQPAPPIQGSGEGLSQDAGVEALRVSLWKCLFFLALGPRPRRMGVLGQVGLVCLQRGVWCLQLCSDAAPRHVFSPAVASGVFAAVRTLGCLCGAAGVGANYGHPRLGSRHTPHTRHSPQASGPLLSLSPGPGCPRHRAKAWLGGEGGTAAQLRLA